MRFRKNWWDFNQDEYSLETEEQKKQVDDAWLSFIRRAILAHILIFGPPLLLAVLPWLGLGLIASIYPFPADWNMIFAWWELPFCIIYSLVVLMVAKYFEYVNRYFVIPRPGGEAAETPKQISPISRWMIIPIFFLLPRWWGGEKIAYMVVAIMAIYLLSRVGISKTKQPVATAQTANPDKLLAEYAMITFNGKPVPLMVYGGRQFIYPYAWVWLDTTLVKVKKLDVDIPPTSVMAKNDVPVMVSVFISAAVDWMNPFKVLEFIRVGGYEGAKGIMDNSLVTAARDLTAQFTDKELVGRIIDFRKIVAEAIAGEDVDDEDLKGLASGKGHFELPGIGMIADTLNVGTDLSEKRKTTLEQKENEMAEREAQRREIETIVMLQKLAIDTGVEIDPRTAVELAQQSAKTATRTIHSVDIPPALLSALVGRGISVGAVDLVLSPDEQAEMFLLVRDVLAKSAGTDGAPLDLAVLVRQAKANVAARAKKP